MYISINPLRTPKNSDDTIRTALQEMLLLRKSDAQTPNELLPVIFMIHQMVVQRVSRCAS